MSSPVSVAVSRSAHHCAMIRLRSTHNDHPTSVSPRTTRHPAAIEPARARHSLDDVVRLASHGHFDRSPSLRLHLDDGIRQYLGCGQAGWHRRVGVPERRCGMASGDPHPRLRPHARTACAAHESSPSRRDSSSSRLPAGRYSATRTVAIEMTPGPAILVTADRPAL